MKVVAEFHVPKSYAKEFLPSETGKSIMDFVRIIQTPPGDDLYEEIARIYRLVMHRDKKYFFLGWDIRRHYSKKELEFRRIITLENQQDV